MKGNLFRVLLIASAILCPAAFTSAQMGGGMGGAMGSGMIVIADDGSVLLTRVGKTSGGMPMTQRALINVTSAGTQRWKIDFTDGWPMMPATKKSLIVVALTSRWMGGGGGTPGNTITVEGFDLATGALRWKTDLTGQMASYPQFSKDGSRFYISLGDYSSTYSMTSKKVVAIDVNGNVLWSVDMTGSAVTRDSAN